MSDEDNPDLGDTVAEEIRNLIGSVNSNYDHFLSEHLQLLVVKASSVGIGEEITNNGDEFYRLLVSDRNFQHRLGIFRNSLFYGFNDSDIMLQFGSPEEVLDKYKILASTILETYLSKHGPFIDHITRKDDSPIPIEDMVAVYIVRDQTKNEEVMVYSFIGTEHIHKIVVDIHGTRIIDDEYKMDRFVSEADVIIGTSPDGDIIRLPPEVIRGMPKVRSAAIKVAMNDPHEDLNVIRHEGPYYLRHRARLKENHIGLRLGTGRFPVRY